MNAPADPSLLSAVHAGLPAPARQSQPAAPRIDAGTVLQIQAAVLAQTRFPAAATAFASELALLFGAMRACIGLLERGSVAIVAMSGEVDFQRNAELCRALAAAMDESIEQGVSIVYPAAPGARPRITLAHAEVARRSAASLITVPLVSAGRQIGALTLEGRDEASPIAGVVESCEQIACLVAPVLELKYNADLPWHARLARAARELRLRAAGPGQLWPQLGLLAAVAVVGALCYWPVEYRVSAPARVEGAVQRILVAPADGYLREAHAKPGDAVLEGQVLVELADQELELERRKWASELAQHENGARAALARGERTSYVVSSGKADAARAQLELVQQQIERSRIRAPFDGIVIKGDLSQTLGAPVQRGDVLLTVAPADQFRLIVEVDERDIGDVRLGRGGALALAALPYASFSFRVARVTPVASAKEGRNFYEVEGQFDGPVAALRPGLQGVAKIVATDQPLAWIWTHRFVDWARLALWTLGS